MATTNAGPLSRIIHLSDVAWEEFAIQVAATAIRVAGGVRHEPAHPGPAPAVLPERLDRRQEQLPLGIARHRAEPLRAQVLLGHGLAVHLLEPRLPVEEVHVRRGAVHEEVDHPLGLRGEVRESRERAAGGRRIPRQQGP